MSTRPLPSKALLALLILYAVLAGPARPAHAAEIVLDDAASCSSIGGTWGGTECQIAGIGQLPAGETLIIPQGVTLYLFAPSTTTGVFVNEGTVINNGLIEVLGGPGQVYEFNAGTFLNVGILTNNGVIELYGGPGDPNGVLNNYGTVTNNGTLAANGGLGPLSGSIDNVGFGVITNNGTIELNGDATGATQWSGSLSNRGGTINNDGTIELNGGPSENSGSLFNSTVKTEVNSNFVTLTGTINNYGTISANGGLGTNSGSILNRSNFVTHPAIINNYGAINANGGSGANSGSILNEAIINNGCGAEINGPVVDEGGTINVIPCTPEELIALLIDDVNDLSISTNSQDQLLKKLTDALEKLEESKPDAAREKLSGFVEKVNGLLADAIIDQVTADRLITDAQGIIDLIDT